MTESTDRVARIQGEWRRERPDLDVTPQGIIGRLHRLAAHLTEELLAVYARHGLSEGEFDVLASLRRAGPPYHRAPGELAQHTMVTTGAMTKRIDRLVAAGLVERSIGPDDGRRRIVALTVAGLAVIDAAFTDHIANERRLVEQLSLSDRAALEPILTRWLQGYESGGDGGALDRLG
ncbi:MarR family winged helix-turn-helix transcriptional regulator [Plantibacter sp. Mn2098]|uniref:MarR family winged helix-turn-helix transcriptional regulator n=1 Tax=Plantibacter sp. Mn2098 TaxID=3395266 RepID=UPI003BDFF993